MGHGGKRAGAGRKKGSPNKATAAIRDAAQEYTDEALATLVEVMKDAEQPGATRVGAANSILDRGHGKPAQALGGDPENPLELVHRIERVFTSDPAED